MEYTGNVNTPFIFITRVSGVGLAAPRALANLGGEHIFLAWDDIYSYQGGRNVIRITTNVRDQVVNFINSEYINRCFMDFIEETVEIVIGVR